MLIYLYDGSFEGILSATHEAYYRREKPDKLLPAQNTGTNLFDRYEDIPTDREKADKVSCAVRAKISDLALRRAFHVFLSESEDKATSIYHYLRLGFLYGPNVDFRLHEEAVLSVHQISRKVTFECHRFNGLIRFARLEPDIYYARYAPDHNITILLAPHFAKRLADQNWVIHDTKRDVAAVYNRKKWLLTDAWPEVPPLPDESERALQDIWKEYYRSISIAERKNLRLQKNMMPARYWKNLTELEE